MEDSQSFEWRSFRRCAFAAAVFSFGSVLLAFPASEALATSAVVQADQEMQDVTAASQQQRVFSGPQPGEEIKPFRVVRVKAGEAEELEIAKDTEEHTTLICFVHQLGNDDRILFGLGLVDFYASRHKELCSHFVLLTDDRDKVLPMLRGWERGSFFTKTLVSISVDGVEGPGSYGLNRNVAGLTVLVAKGSEVVSNLVFQAPNNRDLQKIMAAVAQALDEPEPTLEGVQQELRAERQRRADERIKGSPVFKLAPAEQLGRIMYGMVNSRGNRPKNAERRSQQLLDWAGENEERKSALRAYCKAVLAGDFQLDQYAQAAVQKLAGD